MITRIEVEFDNIPEAAAFLGSMRSRGIWGNFDQATVETDHPRVVLEDPGDGHSTPYIGEMLALSLRVAGDD